MPPIGFALATYRDQELTHRLLRTLNRVFADPPIEIHHDFGQSALDVSSFGANVRVVNPWFRTGWGSLDTVKAMATAIERLMCRADAPQWFYLVTGHCYPTVTADDAFGFLDAGGFDLCMEQTDFYPTRPEHPRYEEWCERYVYPQLRVTLPWEQRFKYRYRTLRRSGEGSRFTQAFPCRSGATYFTGSTAAAAVLAEGFRNKELVDWYAKRPIVDESLFQTILGNSSLRVHKGDLRFIKWVDPAKLPPGEMNPVTLTLEDADAIRASGMHIARKIVAGKSDSLVEWIDRELLKTG